MLSAHRHDVFWAAEDVIRTTEACRLARLGTICLFEMWSISLCLTSKIISVCLSARVTWRTHAEHAMLRSEMSNSYLSRPSWEKRGLYNRATTAPGPACHPTLPLPLLQTSHVPGPVTQPIVSALVASSFISSTRPLKPALSYAVKRSHARSPSPTTARMYSPGRTEHRSRFLPHFFLELNRAKVGLVIDPRVYSSSSYPLGSTSQQSWPHRPATFCTVNFSLGKLLRRESLDITHDPRSTACSTRDL